MVGLRARSQNDELCVWWASVPFLRFVEETLHGLSEHNVQLIDVLLSYIALRLFLHNYGRSNLAVQCDDG